MKTTIKFIGMLVLSFLMGCSSDDNKEEVPVLYNLDAIQGDWYRTGGNNPENNGMLVNVSNDVGTVVTPAGSSFTKGDVKWKTILGQEDRTYSYKELGSDARYYDAVMKLGLDDTLRITVGNAGVGDEQKWVRQFSEWDDCRPYQPNSFTGIKKGSWEKVNEEARYSGLLPSVSDAGGGYYTVTLTNDSGIVPGMQIRASNDTVGAITNGTAMGTKHPTRRKTSFLVHPGISYDVEAIYSSYINVDGPVKYDIEWTFTGRMDCYEPNDRIEDAKGIPKDQTIEAYALRGFTGNFNISGAPQTFDYYKVQIFEPARLKMELLEVPATVNLNVKIFTPEAVSVIADRESISGGETHLEGAVYSLITKRVLPPGTYIISMEIGGSRKTIAEEFSDDIIPEHWDKPYQFKVTTVE